MSRSPSAFVLGYHGCDARFAERVFQGKEHLRASTNDYDWLGEGIYFWEGDPTRAVEWAQEKVARGKLDKAAVVGAIIDLGECLDLCNREGVKLLEAAFRSYARLREAEGLPLPDNRNLRGDTGPDKLIRELDCAVVQHLHEMIDGAQTSQGGKPFFDSVKCAFLEGEEVYPGAAFKTKSHTQIAVRNPVCIVGYFRPLSD